MTRPAHHSRRYPTPAERWRDHARTFRLAQEMNCTPAEAQAELDRRAARDRWQNSAARLAAKQAGSGGRVLSQQLLHSAEPKTPPRRWWLD